MARTCGDVTGKGGSPNMGDVGMLLAYLDNPEEYQIDEWAADVNGDGVIDMGDVILLTNHVTAPDAYPLHCREREDELPIVPIVIVAGVIGVIAYFILKR